MAGHEDMKQYSPEQAANRAAEWCASNTGWRRICDIDDIAPLYKSWEELGADERSRWNDNKGCWREFGKAPCKVPSGFISGAGVFYSNVLDIPRFHNGMMVFKVGEIS